MLRFVMFASLALAGSLGGAFAADILPVHHKTADGPACSTGTCSTGACGTCADCMRINDIKKTTHPVYDCKVKEVCIPNCGLGCLFGCKADCKKIEVRQLVKKFRTDEECVSRCVTPEEASKHFDAQMKKAANPIAPPPVPQKEAPKARDAVSVMPPAFPADRGTISFEPQSLRPAGLPKSAIAE